jgi:ParB-like chromosome segregation protein Spo0J
MNIIQKSVKDIVPYNNNPRINDDAVAVVVTSIKEFGFQVPIILDNNNVIIAGHTRWQAAKQLGLETVPVIVASDLSDAKAKAFRIMDNKSAEMALWDMDKLRVEIDDLSNLDCDLSTIGFDDEELADIYYSQDDAPFEPTRTSMNDRDGRDSREPAFNPSLEPTMSKGEVTDKDLDHAKHRLEINQENKKSMEVICPECYTEFEIGV